MSEKITRLLAAPVIVLFSAGPALTWEATRNGPILDKNQIAEVVKRLAETHESGAKPSAGGLPSRKVSYRRGKAGKSAGSAPKPPSPLLPSLTSAGTGLLLSRRTVEYPQQSGARLADGWDFVTNTRVYSQCINYGAAATDGFQQARMDYTQAVDTETFFASLNVNTSANVSGGIGNFSGKAEGSFNVEASFKLTSKDDLIVAHASVVNGATYVTAQTERTAADGKSDSGSTNAVNIVNPATKENIAGVKISAGALNLLKDGGREMFRAACGDGFIAAIGTGADLYLLYHFTDLETDKRLKIFTSMKGGGGVGVFNAGGSMDSTLQLTDLIDHNKLGIFYVQNGGKIAALPTKAADVTTRVGALPVEAFANGRPLYVIVVPYSELYNWPFNFEPTELVDLRTSLVRYLRRLRSAFDELQVIIADFRTNRGNPAAAAYMHDNVHRLRAIDYPALNDELGTEIKLVEDAIRTLDAHCVNKTGSRHAMPSCGEAMAPYQSKQIDTDDFRFLVRLPVPKNAVDPTLVKQLEAREGDLDDRKYFYSMQLYSHWIERISAQRCALFAECLDRAKRNGAYSNIKTSLNM
ncbi:hypothetical protein ACIPUD_15485 [Bradyrhizobium sp. CAR08]